MCQRSTNRIFGELLCLIWGELADQVYQGGGPVWNPSLFQYKMSLKEKAVSNTR